MSMLYGTNKAGEHVALKSFSEPASVGDAQVTAAAMSTVVLRAINSGKIAFGGCLYLEPPFRGFVFDGFTHNRANPQSSIQIDPKK